ncbi:MAG: NUDIX domain-containing protein [Enterococcus sp.]|jgi:NAD+ diphosphatase|nr:NUDIX domain-containing protein [Enterococcus sp.]
MKYCLECGTKLIEKELEEEGVVPYCPSCQHYRFPVFSVAVSVIIKNTSNDKILLIQQYNHKKNILVAGYINQGENAENTVVREVFEELGLKAIKVHYNRSEYFEKSNTLMMNFACTVEDDTIYRNEKEVDQAIWFPIDECLTAIAPNSLAEKFLIAYYRDEGIIE